MATRRKTDSLEAVRLNVTVPVALFGEVRRIAKEQRLSISGALVALAERGLRAEAEEQLRAGHKQFLAERDPALKDKAGRDLICTIFGTDAVVEDSVVEDTPRP